MKRLYRLTRIPGMSSGQARPFEGIEFLVFFMGAHFVNTFAQNKVKHTLFNCSSIYVDVLKSVSQIVTGQTHLTPVQHSDSVFFLETDRLFEGL